MDDCKTLEMLPVGWEWANDGDDAFRVINEDVVLRIWPNKGKWWWSVDVFELEIDEGVSGQSASESAAIAERAAIAWCNRVASIISEPQGTPPT